jgi:hypothetical protein
VDTNKGFYAPFAIIVREEGNDNAAVRAATYYVAACEKMQGPWKRFNPMTQRSEWLYMRKEVKDTFEQAWSLYETATRQQTCGKTSAEAPASEAAGTQPKNDNEATPQKDADKNGGKPKGGEQAEGASPNPKAKAKAKSAPRSSLDIAFATANLSKKNFQATMSKAGLVVDNITKSDDWAWARASHKPQITNLMDQITVMSSKPFAREFLTMDAKDLRSARKHAELQLQLEAFSQGIDPLISKLDKVMAKVLKMQHEAMKD